MIWPVEPADIFHALGVLRTRQDDTSGSLRAFRSCWTLRAAERYRPPADDRLEFATRDEFAHEAVTHVLDLIGNVPMSRAIREQIAHELEVTPEEVGCEPPARRGRS